MVSVFLWCSAYRSDNFIIGLTNVSASEQPPVIGTYAVCGQYPGAVPAGATVSLQCNGTDLPPARYVIVQFPINDSMNFCELDVCISGIFDPSFFSRTFVCIASTTSADGETDGRTTSLLIIPLLFGGWGIITSTGVSRPSQTPHFPLSISPPLPFYHLWRAWPLQIRNFKNPRWRRLLYFSLHLGHVYSGRHRLPWRSMKNKKIWLFEGRNGSEIQGGVIGPGSRCAKAIIIDYYYYWRWMLFGLSAVYYCNLHIPHTNLHFGSRSFHIAAVTVWNSLPSTLRSSQTLNTFRKHLKTRLFQSAFNSP